MVLKDHVKKGKKLVPAWIANGPSLVDSCWYMERMPEIFWLALAIRRIGAEQTFDVVVELTRDVQAAVQNLRKLPLAFRAYLVSEHLDLTDIERAEIAKRFAQTRWRKKAGEILSDCVVLWENFPIGYLGTIPSTISKSTLVEEVKGLIGECSDRHDDLALKMQAIAVGTELRTGILKMANDLPVPDLDAVITDPKAPKARLAAGFAVTGFLSSFSCPAYAARNATHVWPRDFWNQCFKLQGCEYE